MKNKQQILSKPIISANPDLETSEEASWIDAHCHLADPKYTKTILDDIVRRSQQSGVSGWVQGGICPTDWDKQLLLRQKLGRSFITCFGLHPWWVAQKTFVEIEEALNLLKNRLPQAQALGELGLDFQSRFQNPDSINRQRYAFEHQLEIVKENPKPLVLHIVRAHSEALEILKKWVPFPSSGLVHSFSGSLEIAQEYLSLGFYISIGGAITREGFQKLKKAISSLPQDKIVIETDSPDQTPELPGIQATVTNEPANLIGIAQCVAQWYQADYREILNRSTENLNRLFGNELCKSITQSPP